MRPSGSSISFVTLVDDRTVVQTPLQRAVRVTFRAVKHVAARSTDGFRRGDPCQPFHPSRKRPDDEVPVDSEDTVGNRIEDAIHTVFLALNGRVDLFELEEHVSQPIHVPEILQDAHRVPRGVLHLGSGEAVCAADAAVRRQFDIEMDPPLNQSGTDDGIEAGRGLGVDQVRPTEAAQRLSTPADHFAERFVEVCDAAVPIEEHERIGDMPQNHRPDNSGTIAAIACSVAMTTTHFRRVDS
jgi:hypothetical protein